ncbi:transposase [Arcanobacterium buesumense]|uniref:Transposase n=1 Tax=Arcanobacterium buesumense TaxID=2722751 RepID=A0A6H2ELN1_9ACTO|nr:transposase [Arcanobacterium buesumense]QJC21980.1 transposase [Arcanobacterium buesumense]QJC21984.1 transposase [Arcanobacterium buesumense]
MLIVNVYLKLVRLGLDETSFVRLNKRPTQYVTTLCDVANHQTIDIIPSRSYVEVARFLHRFPTYWKQKISYATLDMSPTYRAVFNVITPHATQVADHFQVITLANRALDRVRRRVQQQTLGHRGRKTDPLYRIRRQLVYGQEKLTDKTKHRIESLLRLGDLYGEVVIAYCVKDTPTKFLHPTSPPLKPCLMNSSTTLAKTSCPKKSNNLAEHSKTGITRSWPTTTPAYRTRSPKP